MQQDWWEHVLSLNNRMQVRCLITKQVNCNLALLLPPNRSSIIGCAHQTAVGVLHHIFTTWYEIAHITVFVIPPLLRLGASDRVNVHAGLGSVISLIKIEPTRFCCSYLESCAFLMQCCDGWASNAHHLWIKLSDVILLPISQIEMTSSPERRHLDLQSEAPGLITGVLYLHVIWSYW